MKEDLAPILVILVLEFLSDLHLVPVTFSFCQDCSSTVCSRELTQQVQSLTLLRGKLRVRDGANHFQALYTPYDLICKSGQLLPKR